MSAASLAGFTMDFISNLIPWSLLIALICLVFAKARGLDFKLLWRRGQWIALVISLFAAVSIQFRQKDAGTHAKSSIESLSSGDKDRFREIMGGVARDASFLTVENKAEVKAILHKAGVNNKESVAYFRNTIIGESSAYQKLFYEDALQAVKTGRPFKSMERENLEKKMLSEKTITEFRIEENEKTIEKIAARLPIATNGTEVLLNSDAIKNILANLNASMKRLDELFSVSFVE
jgi:hypothetical protein